MEGNFFSQNTLRTHQSFHHFLFGLLLWEQHLPSWVDMFLRVISELQIISILIQYPLNQFSIDDIDFFSSIFKEFSHYISLNVEFQFSGDDLVSRFTLGIFSAYLLIIVALTLYLLFMYYLKPNREPALTRLWTQMSIIHYNVIFLMIQSFVLSLIKEISDDSTTGTGKQDIWSEGLILSIGIVIMVINLAFGLITAKYAFHPMKSDYLVASRSSNFAFIGLLFKFIQTLTTSLLSDSLYKKWVSLILSIVFVFIRIVQYMREFAFFHYGPTQTFFALICIQATQVILNLIWTCVAFGRDITFNMVIYSHVIFAFIAVWISRAYIRHVVWKYAVKENKKIKTEGEFFKKLFAIDKILSTGSLKHQIISKTSQNHYELLFMELVSRHGETCRIPACACKLILINKTLEQGGLKDTKFQGFELDRFYYDYIHEFFKENMKYVGANVFLSLQLAYLIIMNNENAFAHAIYIINSLKIPSRHVTLQILKAKVLQKVEAAVKSSFFSNDSGTSMKQIVDYQIAKQYLRDRLAANTKLYIDFWDQYKLSKPQIGKFLSLNRLINIDSENIDKIWESLIKNYARFCYKDYVLYGVYMRTIRSAPFTSEKLFSKYFSLVSRNLQTQGHTDKAEGFFLEEENIMICVSLNPSNFGKVTYASQNIEKLGYTSNELILKGLDTLMPPFYAKHYRNFLLHQITDDEVSVMNKNLDVFLCSSSGHVQPATAYAIPFPYMQTGFYSLISLKTMQNTGERYLFVVASGRIEGMSSNLAEELNFEFAPGTVYFLDQICVDSLKVFKCMNHIHVADRRTSTFSRHDERSEEFSASAHDLLKDSGILPLLRKATLPAIAALKAKMRKQNPLTKKLQKAAEEEIDQKIAEELNSGVVKLRFEEFAMKDTSQTERSQFVFNSVISKISYHTDHLYILKLTEVEIEKEHGSGLESSQRRRKASTDHSHLSKIKDEDTCEVVSLKDKLDHIDEKSEADAILGEESLAMAIPIKKVNSNPSGGLGGLAVTKQAVGNLSPLGKRLKISFASYIRVERIKKVFKPKKPKTQKNSILDGAHLKEAVKRYIQTQRFELNNGGNDDESTSVKSSTRGLTSMAKTEKAIHHQGQGASYKLVKSSVIGFILTSIAVFLYYQFQGGDSFNSLTDNVNVLSLTIARLFLGVEIDRRATIIRLIGSGLMDKERNGSPDFSQTLIENFGSVAANFSQSNNDLRESLSQFNDAQKATFYDPLRVYQVDGTNINYENSFDLCSQLTSSCFRLYSALPNTPAPDNFDLSFILNNTLGDFLTNTDSLFSLLTAEDTSIITGMKNLLMILLIIMIVGGILVVGVLIYGEVKFSKKKLMFFDYFLKISERDVDVILVRSRKLHELLSDNNQSEPSIMKQMQDVELSLKEPKHAKPEVKNMRNIKRKKADFKNLNKDAVIGVFSLILFIACFWIMYGVMYLFFINNQTTVQSKKQQIIDTNLYLVSMSQSITTLYLYIGVEDPSTILIYDEPLPSAWGDNYDYLISSNSFFGNIEGGDYGKYAGEINALISGDLCQLVQNGDPACYIDGDGAKKQGIVGLDNYIMTNLKTLKDSYDISNQTVASKQAVFNNSIYSELERAYFDTLVPAYQELIAIFNTMFLETLDEFQNNILMINMLALVIFLVFGKVYWITGLRRMEVEKMYFKQIMRVIPVNIILQDKFLYSYMINNSKEMMNNWS